MYYLSIDDEDVRELHKSVSVDRDFSLSEILSSPEYFYIEEHGNDLYKICPLFYCTEIVSSNNDDRIFGNQCIITHYDESTMYSFKSEDTILGIIAYPVIITDSLFLLFYDKSTLKPISNVSVSQANISDIAINTIDVNGVSDLDLTYDNFANHDVDGVNRQVSTMYGYTCFNIDDGDCFEITYQGITTTIQVIV